MFEALNEYEFVLGSSSPRRLEILANNLNVKKFQVVKSTFDEDIPKSNVSDIDYVTMTAEQKIPSVVEQLSPNKRYIVLTADTVVSCRGNIFEKPGNPETQLAMLQEYRKHPDSIRVITSVHLLKVEHQRIVAHVKDHEITKLTFNSRLTEVQLKYYVNSQEGLNVAGGFMYQGLGSVLFSGIEGDYFNVVGLPVCKTFKMMETLLVK